VDGDDNMHHHRLNNVACPLTCQVVAVSRCPLSVWLMTWCGLIVASLLLLACLVVVRGMLACAVVVGGSRMEVVVVGGGGDGADVGGRDKGGG